MAKNSGKKTSGTKHYSMVERKSFFAGLFTGLKKTKNKKPTRTAPSTSKNIKNNHHAERKKWFSFLAFNDNGDIFNVETYDTSRANALKQARSKLKRDPEIPCWGVTITNDVGNEQEYYRMVTIDDNLKGGVSDNWKGRYRDTDDNIRLKYGKDLSKPLK